MYRHSVNGLYRQMVPSQRDLVDSLVPRSVTTPIAMNVSEMIGGMPAVTAVFVILTALLGTIIGPMVIRYFRIDNEIARGVPPEPARTEREHLKHLSSAPYQERSQACP